MLYIPQKALQNVQVGLGWDTRCDIDASIMMFNNEKLLYDNVYFGNKTSKDGAIKHSGDNLTGVGSGDDETISINLEKVDSSVETLWATITIFTGSSTFD